MNGYRVDLDDIGVDPSTLEVIESLDAAPVQNTDNKAPKEKNVKVKKSKENGPILKDSKEVPSVIPNDNEVLKPIKKNNDGLLKKILFTIIILLLMGGVAYGVYYYLNLGTKKNKPVSKIDLKIINVFVGEKLSNSIFDYGDFNNIDISACSLNTSAVDLTLVGEYDYSVVCDGSVFSSKVIVKQKPVFKYTTNVAIKTLNQEYVTKDFISFTNEYTSTFNDSEMVSKYLEKIGGPYTIKIDVSNENNESTTAYGIMYVANEKPATDISCISAETTNEKYSYMINDHYSVNSSNELAGINYRLYTYQFLDAKSYQEEVDKIINGELKIDSNNGIALLDDVTNTIKIFSNINLADIEKENNDKEITNSLEIRKFYQLTKKYKCSMKS